MYLVGAKKFILAVPCADISVKLGYSGAKNINIEYSILMIRAKIFKFYTDIGVHSCRDLFLVHPLRTYEYT